MTTNTALAGLVAQARRAASRRGQSLSTAHPLLVMLQNDEEASSYLAQRGIYEGDFARILRSNWDEPSSAVEVALERAHRIAQEMGVAHPRPLHLLLAIARDPRHAGYHCLSALGYSDRKHVRKATSTLSRNRTPSAMAKLHARRASLSAELHTSRQASGISLEAKPLPRRQGTLKPAHLASRLPGAASQAEPGADPTRARGNVPRDAHAAVPPGEQEKAACFVQRSKPQFHLRAHLPLLTGLGRNLTVMAQEGRLDPVVGRTEEIERTFDILLRRRGNNPILVGAPGVGKTSLVEALAQRIASGQGVPAPLKEALLIELTPGALVSGTGTRGALSDRIRRIGAEVAQFEGRVLLFLDEVHALFGSQDGLEELAGELRAKLSRGELQCIGSTTDLEYRKRIERDAALCRQFTRVEVDEPDRDASVAILGGVAAHYAKHHEVTYGKDALEASVDLSARYVPQRNLPDKAIGIVDTAGARVARQQRKKVTRQDVADVVASMAGMPVERLLMSDGERLLALEDILSERIVGQQEVIGRLAGALRKSAVGLRGARPLGTFLFLGQTGVGKTETAKTINEMLFPGSPLVRIDMSELSEPHSVARLLGAPPGYIGHEEGGQLTEAVRHRPYRLVLLDEVEKAHRDVLLALLPLLDEGTLTDARGRKVNFRNTVVVMTSNLGVAEARSNSAIGFSASMQEEETSRELQRAVMDAARSALPPEFWNRIDEPLFFHPLRLNDVECIAQKMLEVLSKVLAHEHDVHLELSAAGARALANNGGYEREYGARPMRRAIARLVERPLAEAILRNQVARGETVHVEAEKGAVQLWAVHPRRRKARKRKLPSLACV